MKIIFDSSVLIAAFVEAHPKHQDALAYLRKAGNREFTFLVPAHTILEVYSVLTGAPFKPRITPAIAKKMIDNNIRKIARVVYLSGKDYSDIIDKMIRAGLQGGIVYDAIIAACAEKSKANVLLTLNPHDFSRLGIRKSVKIISVCYVSILINIKALSSLSPAL